MEPPISNPNPNDNDQPDPLAEELKQMSERLRQLAEKLKAQEQADAEMRANYPLFKKIIYAQLREKFERELPPLPPDIDLEQYAIQEGAQPLEAVIGDLESPSTSS